MNDPETADEWQMAVDAAAGLRGIADCKMYGLLEGGPEINVGRCDDILERGRQRGILPSRSDAALTQAVFEAINAEAKRKAS